MQTEKERLLSAKEVAETFGVTKRTIWRWVSLGKFPRPFKVSKEVSRWKESEILAIIDHLPRG